MISKKPVFIVLMVIGLLIVGFVMLLRGCLSKYDERSAITPSLFFTNGNQDVVFSLVKYDKAKSYSRSGNFVRKSVSTNYFVQINDAKTGIKIKDKKVKHHSDIKQYPVKVLGASKQVAWVFIGEIMAYDPFTLEELANKNFIEEKNPSLKDKLPEENRFYFFNQTTGSIGITATDGSNWIINGSNFSAAATDEDFTFSGKSIASQRIDRELERNKNAIDSISRTKLENSSKLLASGKINHVEYRRMMEEFSKERASMNKERDSMRRLKLEVDKLERNTEETRRRIESLQDNSTSFYESKLNADTISNRWIGIYSSQEFESLHSRFQWQSLNKETSRRILYVSTFSHKDGDLIIEKSGPATFEKQIFLNGGFLLDKKTGLPLRLSPTSYLVIHKSKVGNEGSILISRMDIDGIIQWTSDSMLPDWKDWMVSKNKLILFGTNNKELSGNEINILRIVDLNDGSRLTYDYFIDEIIK
jgi:hypothetical protein